MSRSPRHPSSSAAAAPTATDGGGGGGGGDDDGHHHHHHDVTKYAVPLTAAAIILECLLENEDVTARDVANLAMTSCSFWRVMCDAPLTRVWERVARVYVDRANCLQANYDDRVSLLGVDFSMFDVDDDSDDGPMKRDMTRGTLLQISKHSPQAGKLRQEGKEYLVQDGDVMLFKFNV